MPSSIRRLVRVDDSKTTSIAIFPLSYPYFEVTQVSPGEELLIVFDNTFELSEVELRIYDNIGSEISFQSSLGNMFYFRVEDGYTGKLTFVGKGTEIFNNQLQDFEVSTRISVLKEKNEILPRIKIFRNENYEKEAIVYAPKDLIEIHFLRSGIAKSIYFKMADPVGQIRYHAKSGGEDHEFRTRIQNTRYAGRWTLQVEGTLPQTEFPFEVVYPFYILSSREARKVKDFEALDEEYREKEVKRIMNEINEDCYERIIKLAINCISSKKQLAETEEEIRTKITQSFAIQQHILNGMENDHQKKFEQSVIEYDKALVQILYLKAKALQADDDIAEAIKYYELILSIEPNHEEVLSILDELSGSRRYLRLAMGYIQKESFEKALKQLNLALDEDPENDEALYYKALCLNELRAYQDAETILKVLCARYPENKEYKQLLQQVKDARQEEIQEIGRYLSNGNEYYHNNEYEKAIEEYDKILEIDENHVETLYMKGLMLRDLLSYDEAIIYLERVVALDFDNTYSAKKDLERMKSILELTDKSVEAFNQENYGECVNYLDRLLVIDEKNADALYLKIQALKRMKRYQEALDALKQLEGLDPNYKGLDEEEEELKQLLAQEVASDLLDQAEEELGEKNFESAMNFVNEFLVSHDNSDGHWLKARIHYEVFEFSESLAEIESVLTQDPKHTEASILRDRIQKILNLNEIMITYERNEDYVEAINTLDDLAELNFNPALKDKREELQKLLDIKRRKEFEKEIEDNLQKARQCIDQQSFEEALEPLQRVLDLDESNPEALYLYAIALKHLNRFSEALDALEKIEPKDEKTQELYDEITTLGQEQIREERIEKGDSLYQQEDYDGAIEQYEKVLEQDPEDVDTLIKTGKAHKKLNRFERALEYFKRAFSLKPDYDGLQEELDETQKTVNLEKIDLYLQKAREYRTEEKPKKAISNYKKVLEIDPDHLEALYEMGELLKKQGELEEARECFLKIKSIDPEYKDSKDLLQQIDDALIALYTNDGNENLKKKKYQDAINLYNKALDINPNNPDVLLLKAKAYQKKGGLKEAHKTIDSLLKIDNKHREGLYEKGVLYLQEKDYENAIKILERTLKEHPGYEEAKAQLNFAKSSRAKQCMENGNVLFRRKQYSKAVQAYDCVIKYNPSNKFAHNNKGLALKFLDKTQEGIKCYKAAIEIDPTFKNAWNNLGIATVDSGYPLSALPHYDKALEIDPKYKQAWNNKGLAYHQLKKYEDAVECYQKAIDADPKYKNPYANQGNSLAELDRHNDAVSVFRKAIELDEGYVVAISGLGISLLELKEYDEALLNLEKAIELDSNFDPAKQGLARIKVEMEKYDEAIVLYDDILKNNPNFATGWYFQGLAYSEMEDFRSAEKCFERAVRHDPNNKVYQKSLKDVKKKV
ncbi:MAG: tetratricopeptide repeat protein [Candidatus Heimdallarchaeota archaeon]|nr:tetratricopeptide repeat protein [Candidatus Heimdallarchaeota archaeon]